MDGRKAVSEHETNSEESRVRPASKAVDNNTSLADAWLRQRSVLASSQCAVQTFSGSARMHHPDFRFQLRQRCQHAVQAHNYASQPPTIVLVFRATQGRARATGRCSLSWWQVLGCKQAASFKILQLSSTETVCLVVALGPISTKNFWRHTAKNSFFQGETSLAGDMSPTRAASLMILYCSSSKEPAPLLLCSAIPITSGLIPLIQAAIAAEPGGPGDKYFLSFTTSSLPCR